MKALLKLVESILYRYDIEIAEVQSIIAKLSFSLVLFGVVRAPDTINFITFLQQHQNSGVYVFSWVVVLLGLFHLLGMVFNNSKVRLISTFASVLTWTFLAVVLATQGAPVALLLSSTFVLSSTLVYLRLTGILNKQNSRERKDDGIHALHSRIVERSSCISTGGPPEKTGEV